MSTEAILQAVRADMAEAGIPTTEFSADFAVKMLRAMMVSYHKYGRVADAYPLKFDAVSDIRARLKRYRETGNMHYLVDVANFAMIETMHPAPERSARWGTNDAADSPGRTTASGHRLVQEDNSGGRIMGETILHHPADWIDWQGGECPVLDCVRVDVVLRGGRQCNGYDPRAWDWSHGNNDADIIAYRLSDA